jgi:hypothetical protein
MVALPTTLGRIPGRAAGHQSGAAWQPTNPIRRPPSLPMPVEIAPISLGVSKILTIFCVYWSSKKPPAGVHVVVAFNRNVAVHPCPAGLAFSETEGLGRAPANLGRGAV